MSIGVDLDGTLAYYSGYNIEIGEPIEPMMARVRNWLSAGEEVKIFTARACMPEQIPIIHAWLEKHGLPKLEVTNVKDLGMREIWDDICVGVKHNTGIPK